MSHKLELYVCAEAKLEHINPFYKITPLRQEMIEEHDVTVAFVQKLYSYKT